METIDIILKIIHIAGTYALALFIAWDLYTHRASVIDVIKWLGKILSDQKGNPSAKRIALVVVLYYFGYMIRAHVDRGASLNETLLGAVVLIILVCIGVITSEFFKKDGITSLKDAIG